MSRKNRILKMAAAGLSLCLFMGNTAIAAHASTYDYVSFPYSFNYGEGMPSSATHVSQTVMVQSNAESYAYASCTSYTFAGNQPVLTVQSCESAFPTTSVSFTGIASARSMRYTKAIPTSGTKVQFRGVVTEYSKSFIIMAKVKG